VVHVANAVHVNEEAYARYEQQHHQAQLVNLVLERNLERAHRNPVEQLHRVGDVGAGARQGEIGHRVQKLPKEYHRNQERAQHGGAADKASHGGRELAVQQAVQQKAQEGQQRNQDVEQRRIRRVGHGENGFHW
jgi:hypothetical protein